VPEPYGNQEIADRLAIDDLLTRYTMAVDDGDWDALDTVFTADAVIDYTSAGGIKGTLHEIKPWLAAALANFPVRQHLICNKKVTFDGDRATVRAYFFNPMNMPMPDGTTRYMPGGGYYNHQLVRTADGWRSEALHEEEVWRVGLPENLEIPD
jgi:SnoaL-like domain